MLWKVNMTEKKIDPKEFASDIMLADVMLRVTAMEKLLVEKGIFTKDELANTTEEIAKSVAKVVIEKATKSKNMDDFIASLESSANPKKDINN